MQSQYDKLDIAAEETAGTACADEAVITQILARQWG